MGLFVDTDPGVEGTVSYLSASQALLNYMLMSILDEVKSGKKTNRKINEVLEIF